MDDSTPPKLSPALQYILEVKKEREAQANDPARKALIQKVIKLRLEREESARSPGAQAVAKEFIHERRSKSANNTEDKNGSDEKSPSSPSGTGPALKLARLRAEHQREQRDNPARQALLKEVAQETRFLPAHPNSHQALIAHQHALEVHLQHQQQARRKQDRGLSL
jgi:hypothetical protein